MPITVNMPGTIVIPVPMAPADRKRLDELTVKTDRSAVESAELSALHASVNTRQVTLVAGMQEVDDDVARHPLVAKFRASDKQAAAHKRVEELEVELAVMTAERDEERRKAMGAVAEANIEAVGSFELTEEQVLRLDQLHAKHDRLNPAELAEFNFLRNHRLPEPNPQLGVSAAGVSVSRTEVTVSGARAGAGVSGDDPGAARAQVAGGPRTPGHDPDSARQPSGRPSDPQRR